MDIIDEWIEKPDSFLSDMTIIELFEMEAEYSQKLIRSGKDMKMYMGIIHGLLKPTAMFVKRNETFTKILKKAEKISDDLALVDDLNEIDKLIKKQKKLINQVIEFLEN